MLAAVLAVVLAAVLVAVLVAVLAASLVAVLSAVLAAILLAVLVLVGGGYQWQFQLNEVAFDLQVVFLFVIISVGLHKVISFKCRI